MCCNSVYMHGTVINQLLMERSKQLIETPYTQPKEEETFLQLENTGEQAPDSGGTKAEKEIEVSSRE